MVFSSLVFLFAFLPAVIWLYYVVPKSLKNAVLLFASLFFYAWGEIAYVLVMLVSIAVNFGFGLLIDRSDQKNHKKWALISGISLNLLLLAGFKYWGFLADNLNILLSLVNQPALAVTSIHLPIGISFFTFQAMSYLVDVYRHVTPAQRSLTRLALYISLFPQLIAGPIVRYHDVAKQLTERQESFDLFSLGVQRFIIGLAKKVLIANLMAGVADSIFAQPENELSMAVAWLGIIAYSLQIYFDFSGYSDMAIGLGMIFGFRFLENFNYPYISTSIQEFWQRWHISLSNWFRDYLYIPLGGNRKGAARTYVNLFIVFILCGFWHGASWNFLVWGLIHGSFLAIERAGWLSVLPHLSSPLRHLYVLLVVTISWVFFRAEDLPQALTYLERMFVPSEITNNALGLYSYINNEVILVMVAAMIGATPLIQQASKRIKIAAFGASHVNRTSVTAYNFLYFLVFAALLSLSIVYLAAGAYNPFIYFRF